MILGIYRSNHPGALISLPLVTLILWIPSFFIDAGLPSSPTPFPVPIMSWLKEMPWLRSIFGILFVSLGGITLNRILNDSEFQERENYLPSFLYVFFMSILPEQWDFHPLLVGNLFLLLSLKRLFEIFRQPTVKSNSFDSGLYLGIATLFYFPLIFVSPFIWISLMILRSFNWREYFLPLLGIITPYVYVFTYYFWIGELGIFGDILQFGSFSDCFTFLASSPLNMSFQVFFGLTFLLGIVFFLSSYTKSIMHNKKQKTMMLAFSLFLIVLYFISCFQDASWRFSLLAPSLGGILPFMFAGDQKKWLGTFLFYLWLLAFAGITYWQFTM